MVAQSESLAGAARVPAKSRVRQTNRHRPERSHRQVEQETREGERQPRQIVPTTALS